MSYFKNKVVWVTGASSGIGEALVKRLSAEGASPVISARREDELHRVAGLLNLPEEKILVLPLDLQQSENMKEKVNSVMQKFGRIDLVIHNAGVSQRSLVAETLLSVDKQLMEINYLGTIALTKAVLPEFIKAGQGHFAVVTSAVGKFGSPMRSSYSAAKHALHGFFDSLRAEHHQDNVKVSMLCPGFIKTNVSVNALTADGSPQGTMDQATGGGMDVDLCAKKMLNAIRKGKNETYIGGAKEVFGIYLKRYIPAVFEKLIRNSSVT